MSDYRAMFDAKYLAAFHLVDQATGQKRDVTVTIAKVEAAKIVGEGGKQDRKPLVHFEGKDLPMIFNKTNGKVVAAMYGNDTRGWVAKRITLYSTTTSVGGKECDCIRVRPQIPPAASRQQEKSDAAS
jgi:hypothetical protein